MKKYFSKHYLFAHSLMSIVLLSFCWTVYGFAKNPFILNFDTVTSFISLLFNVLSFVCLNSVYKTSGEMYELSQKIKMLKEIEAFRNKLKGLLNEYR